MPQIEEFLSKLPENASKEQVAALLKEFNDTAEKEHQNELNQKVSEKVSVEKDKLYDSLKKERDEKDRLSKELGEVRKNLEEKLAEEKRKGDGGDDSERRIKELEAQLEKTKANALELATGIRDEFAKELTRRDLEAVRARLIEDAKGKIVPELVQGNTVEELTKSAEGAKARFDQMAAEQRKQIEGELLAKGILPNPDGHKSGSAGREVDGAGDSAEWKLRMTQSKEDFLKDAQAYLDKEFPKG